MKTKLIAIFLALVAGLGTLWASNTQVKGIYYDFDSNTKTASVTYKGNSYNNANTYEGSITIPSSVTYLGVSYSVISIGKNAFLECSGLTSVEIPNSVMSIEDRAFYGCTGLSDMTIPNSVTRLGGAVFYGCTGITSINIPNSVTSIGGYAFYGCSGLTSVTIGDSVTNIETHAFGDCTSLTKVIISDIANWCNIAFDDVSANPLNYAKHLYLNEIEIFDLIIPEGITKISDYAFYSCSAFKSVTISNSVTHIGARAFHWCTGLTSITIPNNVTSIGGEAFYQCTGLTSVSIPSSVTSIGSRAFNWCEHLNSVYINDIEAWCNIAFDDALANPLYYAKHLYVNGIEIIDLVIPEGVSGIGDYAFYNCTSLTSVTIQNSVTSIGGAAFRGCTSLTSIEIPSSVTKIGGGAFCDCKGLRKITVPNSVTSIGSGAFTRCSGMTTVELPNNITSIEDRTFAECTSLISVNIPDSVTNIGAETFYRCSRLKSITIPSGITSIEYRAFLQCVDLSSVTVLGKTPATLGTDVFDNKLSAINVPCGTLDDYKSAWASYASKIQYLKFNVVCEVNDIYAGNVAMPQNVNVCDNPILTAIPNYGYHFKKWSDGITDNPRTIELTQDTTFTAEFAISTTGTCGDNNQLTWSFDSISNTLAISGSGALNGNYTYGLQAPTKTERLIIEDGVTSIGNIAFKDMCPTITSIVLPRSVTAIGDSAFVGLTNRKFNTLVLPKDIIYIGAHAFDGASYLQTIHFGEALEEIGEYAFNGCSRVKEMTCLAEITPNVGNYALTSISSQAKLFVPADYLVVYQIDANWNRFLLNVLGAEETTIVNNVVTVEADENTALFTWPTNSSAETYTITITKDGVVFCTLIFNANGQLTGIAFAPQKNGEVHSPAATTSTTGMSFTVTGLDVASKYAYRLTATDSNNKELVAYNGEFATTGYDGDINPGGEPENNIEGVDQINKDQLPITNKVMFNGQILILRGSKTYTVTGQEAK